MNINDKIIEALVILDELGYIYMPDDNIVKFYEEKIRGKVDEIGTISLHKLVYDEAIKDDVLVDILAIESIANNFQGFQELYEKDDSNNEYMIRSALINLFYDKENPTYENNRYYFSSNIDDFSEAIGFVNEIKKFNIFTSKL